MSVDLGIGTRIPTYCTSMGRVLLAYLPPAEQDAYLARVKIVRHTPRTIPTSDKLRRELDGTRRAGYAIVDQEL
jgi:IclR family pca regulon transcriptional regulator